jgi:heme-degrading monooxygenase HmoA
VYVSVTKTKDRLDQPIEYARIAGEEMVPWLAQIEGWQGLLMLSNEEDGRTLVLSFWESREVAEQHHTARMQFRDRITSAVSVEVEETSGYELVFSHWGRESQSAATDPEPPFVEKQPGSG